MRSRLPELIGVVAVFVAVTVLLQLAPTPVAGQAQTDPGQEAAAPATPTPWGEPDLQGLWLVCCVGVLGSDTAVARSGGRGEVRQCGRCLWL